MRANDRFSAIPEARRSNRAARLSGLLLLCLLTACAGQPPAPAAPAPGEPEPTVVSYPNYEDPLIGFNRAVFTVNDVAYRYALIPIAKGYNWLLPEVVRTGVGNVFHNIKMPIRSVNYLLQLKPKDAGVDVLRFVINSTVGLLGIFDPAEAWLDLKRSDNGFENTLSRYGSGYGAYIVLPFFGPSDLRNGGGRILDYALNPIPYLTNEPDTTIIMASDALQEFAPTAEKYERLRTRSDDPYLFFRNLYLQGVQRDAAQQQPPEPAQEVERPSPHSRNNDCCAEPC